MTQRNLDDDFLCHHGILGQKWGKRRYQNPDGSLTDEGRSHWGIGPARKDRKSFRLESSEEKKERLELKAKKQTERAERAAQRRENSILKKKIDLINKGDKDAIYKNRKLFTDEELDYASKRIDLQNRFKTAPVEKATPKTIKQIRKDKIVADGDAKKIYENRKLFTDEELKAAIARADALSKLNPDIKNRAGKASNAANNSGKPVTEKILNGLGTATKIATGAGGLAIGGYTAYNQIASIANTIGSEKSKENLRNKVDKWVAGDTSSRSSLGKQFLKIIGDEATDLPVWSLKPWSSLEPKNKKPNKDDFFKTIGETLGVPDMSKDDKNKIWNEIYGD